MERATWNEVETEYRNQVLRLQQEIATVQGSNAMLGERIPALEATAAELSATLRHRENRHLRLTRLVGMLRARLGRTETEKAVLMKRLKNCRARLLTCRRQTPAVPPLPDSS